MADVNNTTSGVGSGVAGTGTNSGTTTGGTLLYKKAWWGKGVLFGAFYCDEPGFFQLSDQVLAGTNNYISAVTTPLNQNSEYYPAMIGEPISSARVVVKYGPGQAKAGQIIPGFTFYKQPVQNAWYTGVNGLVFFVGHEVDLDSASTWVPGFYVARFSLLDGNGNEADFQEKTFYYDPNQPNMEYHIVKACFSKQIIQEPEIVRQARWLIPLDPNDVTNNIVQKVVYGLWPDSVDNLTSYIKCTASIDDTNALIRVSDYSCSSCLSDKLFDISYGDNDGSGSTDLGGNDYYSVSNAVYGQYRGLFMENANSDTRIAISGSNLDYFYAINIKQSLLRDALDVGTLELNIAQLSGSATIQPSGSGRAIRLIDSSKYLDPAYYVGAGPVYYIVSGSLEEGIYNSSSPILYGLLHPKIGAMILSGPMLDASASFSTSRLPDASGNNPTRLFTALSGSAQYTDASGDALGFKARSIAYEHSILTYLRVRYNDLNLTNNPTYVKDELGTVKDDFINKPKVYITTIGLYNSNKELVAVGKVSKPILRTGTDESFFKVRLKQ